MNKTPSIDDIQTAITWLDIDEKAEDSETCHRVAEWLKGHQQRQVELNRLIEACEKVHEAACVAGMSVTLARAVQAADSALLAVVKLHR